RTFSCVSFPSVFAFKEGMWDTPISALGGSPTVTHDPRLSTAYENSPAIFSRVSGGFVRHHHKACAVGCPRHCNVGWSLLTTSHDTVERIKRADGRLQPEHPVREAVLQALCCASLLETLQERARYRRLDVSVAVEELPPQRQKLILVCAHLGGGQVRGRKQPAVRVEVIEP